MIEDRNIEVEGKSQAEFVDTIAGIPVKYYS